MSPEPGGGTNDTAGTTKVLVRMKLDIPADPSTAKPDSIKATILDIQDMVATGSDILFPANTAGMVSIAVGREVTPGGPRVLYTTDFDGSYYTLTPAP